MLFKTLSGCGSPASILVRAAQRIGQVPVMPLLLLAGLGGCGQQGALYIPTDAAAANRATLPQTLRPGGRATPANPPASAPLNSPSPSLPTQ